MSCRRADEDPACRLAFVVAMISGARAGDPRDAVLDHLDARPAARSACGSTASTRRRPRPRRPPARCPRTPTRASRRVPRTARATRPRPAARGAPPPRDAELVEPRVLAVDMPAKVHLAGPVAVSVTTEDASFAPGSTGAEVQRSGGGGARAGELVFLLAFSEGSWGRGGSACGASPPLSSGRRLAGRSLRQAPRALGVEASGR
jgi:hypothetical protein